MDLRAAQSTAQRVDRPRSDAAMMVGAVREDVRHRPDVVWET